jgi:hypothetical protein
MDGDDVHNLSKGKNDALLSVCKPLSDYMALVNYISTSAI